ncbi:retrotransposon protein [Cucumis melo var. makuwa]|uniref:Retrotransposon protein n=1 Tax=Cucumis melo var. makuwa TaxID=1194695 RepID=A0A5D3BCB7_CUCMM|nr:retrotransposon protein [Cucumis melo var. makuwa]TYJ96241.1 retrotransposon protein [Cucumis melo var. makuwa]
MPASVVFLAMAQNIKAFVVGILFPIDFVYLAMSHFGSILCSLACPPSTPPSLVLNLSSQIHLLTFFLSSPYHCFFAIVSLVEPTSYQEASTDPLWQKAMNDELQALEKTHTWDYVDLPSGKRSIGCKWIYKIKTHSDGTIECYKTRLVAKGYFQKYGIDYEETFAHVARITSVRSLLVVAAAK